MRRNEIEFRAWHKREMCFLSHNDLFDAHEYQNPFSRGDLIIEEFSGLYTRNGLKIFEGDRLRFFKTVGGNSIYGCVWEGDVIFEDGVFTVSILNASQVENPKDWNMPHDWIKSRHWSTQVGYGEYGTWNCPRRSLNSIHQGFKKYENDYKPICEKFGYGNRYINAEIVGNIHISTSQGE